MTQTADRYYRVSRRVVLVLGLAITAVLPQALTAETIVHPGHAAPEIVLVGKPFPLMFRVEPGEKVQSAALVGPYNSAAVMLSDAVEGEYVYDKTANASCNYRAIATVPADCPAELYDLVVRTNKREVTAKRAVQVLKAFRKRYTLVHVSDAHITKDWKGDLATGYDPGTKQVEQVVNTINIIGADFVIHTGDCIMDYTRPDVAGMDTRRKWECFYEGSGGVRSFHGLNCPFFTTAGNHDHFKAKNDAGQYAEYNGLRAFGFAYGTGRFMAIDDSLAKDIPAQLAKLKAFLKQAGPGEFRVLCEHKPMNVDSNFLAACDVQLALTGHIHRNTEQRLGSALVLTTKNVGRPVSDNPGWFRVITIEGSKIVSNVVVKYGDNKTCTPLLTRDYKAANDGSASTNTATITNGFDIAWPSCKVRFVMKPGEYTVTGGTVENVIKSDKRVVYDVRTPVGAEAKAAVTIQPK